MSKTDSQSEKKSKGAVTARDVALRAGAHQASVSVVLNGAKSNTGVSPEVRERILAAAQELNYRPNLHAQRLATGRSANTVALFSLNLDLGVSTRTLQLMQEALDERDYSVLLYARSYHGSKRLDDPEKQVELMNSLRRQHPLAIICHTQRLVEATLDELRAYQAEGGTVICYSYGGRGVDGADGVDVECDQVIFNDGASIGLAVRHLLEKGHREIGLFTPGKTVWPHFSHTLKTILAEYGLQSRPEWLLCGTNHPEHERDGAFGAEQFLRLKERPTAMCVVNDFAASGFIGRLRQAGIEVPRDLSVTGFDNNPIATYSHPPLTTVQHPVLLLAEQIVSMLCQRLEGQFNGPPRRISFGGELVVRQSTAIHNS